ncbi:MAG: hypothetical protein IOC58_11195 [Methylobacterium sp.]|nr:hypothetical protein [Methylobacterium sp.]MCA3613557.1 hypothetical protein [Methylobacterium sp.]MCA3624545.1 hypothetical protein [Methylobacterium sp.]
MTLFRLAALALALGLPASVALAQTAPAPQNPLRPANSRPAPAAAAPAAQAPAAEAPKPRRKRSEAQLANDNRMRACGQEWRQNKAKLTAEGKTWRAFNVECGARLKAQGR